MTNLAPIIVFCYNRPWHVEQTLESLSRNELADQSVLYIYCDGPKVDASDEMRKKIMDVRQVVRKRQWCKEVYIIESEINKGLAENIIDGVSNVISKYGRAIVVEDDLLTSPYFLKYMNSALEKYENYPSVFTISANRPPVNKMKIPKDYEYDVFVSLRPFSTGWATWKTKWERIDWSMDYLEDFLQHSSQMEAFNRGGDDLTSMLCLQREHKIDSWAIRYAFQHFYHHAVAILPCVPYVDNIGFDGTGIHSGLDDKDFRNDVLKAPSSPRFPNIIYEDKRIINAFYNYYTSKKRPLWQKFINFICRKIGVQVPFVLKKFVYAK